MTSAQCDACAFYVHHANPGQVCRRGHRPRFYLPTERTILGQRWGHRRVCGDFKPAGERRDEVTEADLEMASAGGRGA